MKRFGTRRRSWTSALARPDRPPAADAPRVGAGAAARGGDRSAARVVRLRPRRAQLPRDRGPGPLRPRRDADPARSTCPRSPPSWAASRNAAAHPRCCGSSPPPASTPLRRPGDARRAFGGGALLGGGWVQLAAFGAAAGVLLSLALQAVPAARELIHPLAPGCPVSPSSSPSASRRRRPRSSFASPGSRGIAHRLPWRSPPIAGNAIPRTQGARPCRSPSASCASSAGPPSARPPSPKPAGAASATCSGAAGLAVVLVVAGSPSPPPAARRPSPDPRPERRRQARRRHPGEGRRARRPEGPDHRHRVPRPAVPDLRRGVQGQPPPPDRQLRPHRQGQAAGAHAELHRPGLRHRRQVRARRRAAGQAVGVPGDVLRVAGPGELRLRDRRLPRAGRQGVRRRRRQGRRLRRRRSRPGRARPGRRRRAGARRSTRPRASPSPATAARRRSSPSASTT